MDSKPKYKLPRSRSEALAVLRDVWGHGEFRGRQWDVIEAVLEGRDVLGVLPTGTGKSICYQLPACLSDGVTLVISPLVALMNDQVDSLARRGIGATSIDSSLSAREADQRLTDCQYGKYRLLYVSPERLQSTSFLERCRNISIDTVAVDEAHCISEWGHNFRPAYLEIAEGLLHIGRPPIVALTATATPAVRVDIERSLKLVNPRVVAGGFDRPNIVWTVFRNENKRKRVEAVLKGVPGSGIVYAGTRRESEEWATWLRKRGITADAYHAGLVRRVRDDRQEDWMSGRSRVIVATSAFGMGIDKPDVRFVIHVSLSSSLEAYYQEAGRAGRDGHRSYAILLYNDGDERVQAGLIDNGFPDARITRKAYDTICSMAGISTGSVGDGPIAVDVAKVAEVSSCDPATIRGVIEYLERQGVFSLFDAGASDGLVRAHDDDELRRQADPGSTTTVAKVAAGLLRTETLADSQDRWRPIRFDQIAKRSGVRSEDVSHALQYLSSLGAVEWKVTVDSPLILLNDRRTARLDLDVRQLRRGRKLARGRLRELIGYANSRTCRRERILVYFGESGVSRCGRCDVCLDGSAPIQTAAERRRVGELVLERIRSGTPKSDWTFGKDVDERSVNDSLDWLIREDIVRPSNRLDGTFELVGSGRIPADVRGGAT